MLSRRAGLSAIAGLSCYSCTHLATVGVKGFAEDGAARLCKFGTVVLALYFGV